MHDRLMQSIYDHLYDDRTGRPVDSYSEDDLVQKTDLLFQFVEHRAAYFQLHAGQA